MELTCASFRAALQVHQRSAEKYIRGFVLCLSHISRYLKLFVDGTYDVNSKFFSDLAHATAGGRAGFDENLK